MEEVESMKFYCYKEFPVDYSNLSVDELDEKIKAEQERLKNSNFAHGKHPVCLDKSA